MSTPYVHVGVSAIEYMVCPCGCVNTVMYTLDCSICMYVGECNKHVHIHTQYKWM